MDFNKLFDMISELSGNDDIVLGDMRVDGKKIFIELDLIPKVDQEDKIIPE